MTKVLWDKFGFFVLLAGVAGLIFLGVAASFNFWRVPTSIVPEMDMRKVILFERELKTDVLYVKFEDDITQVVVLWSEDWVGTPTIADFLEKYDPIIVTIFKPDEVVVTRDGEAFLADGYFGVGKLWCINEYCDGEPFNGVLNDIAVLDWDWGQH